MSTDCEICKPEPIKKYDGPGEVIEMPGTRHRRECPLVPNLEPSEELKKQLASIRDAERRAWVEAQNWIIG